MLRVACPAVRVLQRRCGSKHARDRVPLVSRIPVFDDRARGDARTGGAGEAEIRPRTTAGRCRSLRYLTSPRADRDAGGSAADGAHSGVGDRLGEHSLRPAMGGALPETRGTDGGGRSRRQPVDRVRRARADQGRLGDGAVRAPDGSPSSTSSPRRTRGAASLAEILSIFLTLNVLLCAFNLIPLPPLDGASVIGLFIPDQRHLEAARAQSHADVPARRPRSSPGGSSRRSSGRCSR